MYYIASIRKNSWFQPQIVETFQEREDAETYARLMSKKADEGQKYTVLTDEIPEPIGEEIEDVPESTL